MSVGVDNRAVRGTSQIEGNGRIDRDYYFLSRVDVKSSSKGYACCSIAV